MREMVRTVERESTVQPIAWNREMERDMMGYLCYACMLFVDFGSESCQVDDEEDS